jgi:hypothetical protein
MLVSLSGGGPDNRDWRDFPAGAELDVADWEADDLLRIGLAVAAAAAPPAPSLTAPDPEPPPPEPPPAEPDTGISPVAAVSPVAQAAVTSAGAVAAGPPAPHENKQAWIDWAVTQGLARESAETWTKADLISRYGGRL